MTLNTCHLGIVYLYRLVLVTVNVHTKTEMSRFTLSKDMKEDPTFIKGHVTLAVPPLGGHLSYVC